MADIGWQELLVILVILLLVFGASRLPALARSLGASVRGFKTGLDEATGDSPDEAVAGESETEDAAA